MRIGKRLLGNRKRRKRAAFFETLEQRMVLAAAWTNPLDSLDVNQSRSVSALDALVVINDLARNGLRSLPEAKDEDAPFIDTNLDGESSPLDALFVINALARGRDSENLLEEAEDGVQQLGITVGTGQEQGVRRYRFGVETFFDESDESALLEDTFAVYVVDPSQPDATLLSGNVNGGAAFTLSGDRADFTSGVVTFDGQNIEIDFSSLADREQVRLVFQLINFDSDEGSRVKVNLLSNEVDPEGVSLGGLESREQFDLPAVALDTSQLNATSDVELEVADIRLESGSNQLSTSIRARNVGEQFLGKDLVVEFPDNVVSNASGTTGAGHSYVSFRDAIPSGGLRPGLFSDWIDVTFDGITRPAVNLVVTTLVGAANRPPQIAAIDPITTMPGDAVEIPINVTDADGDTVTVSIQAQGGMPTATLRSDNTLVFTPRPDELGVYQFNVIADDGATKASRQVQVTSVTDPLTTTRLSGVIQNTDQQPLAGLPIELGTFTTTTDTEGRFTLDFGATVPSQDDALFVRGEAFPGAESYPFIAEKLHLLLDEVFEGNNNVLTRPIYLPVLNTADAVTIDPAVDTTVSMSLVEGEVEASVFVAANSLNDQAGNPFTGQLSITEVPADLTPAALPAGFIPDSVVTIQPGEMVFTQPAPLTLPNRSGLPAGFEFDLWSINPVTGTFDVVGKGRVSADGTVIETIEGGIRNSSWHLFILSDLNIAVSSSTLNLEDECDTCETLFPGTSNVNAHSGEVVESHRLPTYKSLGETRGVKLVYNSFRADPRPIVHGGYRLDLQLGAPFSGSVGIRGISNLSITGNNLSIQSEDHYWRSGPDSNRREIAILADLSTLPSGLYDYTLNTGVLFLDGSFGDRTQTLQPTGVRGQSSGQLVHVNSVDSAFGSGWELAGLQYLVENVDGSVLLVDGNGSEMLFQLATDGVAYDSPPGHFSTLEKLGDGTFRHTTTDRTVSTFDAQNRLIAVTDRNNNETSYGYSNGQLVSMTDPVGLMTTFNYTDGKVTSIIDPANRTTSFEYDPNGNLIRATDPDGTTRTWDYDDKHHIVSETDKRGFREEMQYDIAGRAKQAIRKDGSVLQYRPVQVQGLFPSELTTDPDIAPPSSGNSDSEAIFVDGNGNVVRVDVNSVGQNLGSQDGVGILSTTRYDDELLPVSITDARGFETQFTYDDNGNLLSVLDTISTGGGGISFASSSHPLTGAFGNLLSDDINGDGIQDFVNDGVIYLGDGAGGLQTPIILEVPQVDGDPAIFRAADMNGDGLKDIIASSNGTSDYWFEIDGYVFVWLANIDGTFADPVEYVSLQSDFDPEAEESVSVLQPGLVIADFNNDNQPDVLLTQPLNELGETDTSLVLLLNDGSGDLLPMTEIVPGFNGAENIPPAAWDVKAADLDGDGNQDLVLSNIRDAMNGGNHVVTVMLGDGAGGFGLPVNHDLGFFDSLVVEAGLEREVLELDDFNGDGDLDVVVASMDQGFASVLLGDGSGGFGTPNVIATYTPPPTQFGFVGWTAIETADLNGDSVVDIALQSFSSKQITVLLGVGDGTFQARADYKYDTSSESLIADDLPEILDGVHAIDFNNDGILDLVTAGVGEDLAYLKGLGDGTFVSWTQIDTSPTFANAPMQVETIDVDKDGLLDIVTRTFQTGAEVRFGLGNGEFSDAVVLESGAPTEETRQMVLLDANGDGFLDIAYEVAAASTQTYRLHTNNQDRTFTSPTTLDLGVDQARGLVSGDFNNDGNADLVVANRTNSPNPGEIRIAEGDGTGAFTLSTITLSKQPTDVVVVDVNNDGNQDLIVSFEGSQGAVLLGDGSGGFAENSTLATGSITRMEVADINDDGFADLAFVVYNSTDRQSEVQYLVNDGTGQFGSVQVTTIAASGAPATLRPFLSLNDINGDELPDIVLASRRQYYVAINNQGSGFGSVQTYRGGGFAPSLVDINGDRVTDIVGAKANLITGGKIFHNESAITIHYGVQESVSTPRTFTYDPAFNQLTSMTDELGRQTFFEIDPTNGNTLSITQVIGLPDVSSSETDDLVTSYTYTANGLIDLMTDPLGRVTDFDYDSLGRNTQSTYAKGTADEGIVTFSYDAAGNITRVVDPNLNTSTYTYDALNRQLTLTDAAQATATFTYDDGGNLTDSIDRTGSEMTYEYDALSRLIGVTDEQSNLTQFEYDLTGNQSRVTDPLGQQTEYTYDSRNRTTSMIDPDGGVTRFFYDSVNNLTRLVDPVGNLTNFSYDARNRLTGEVDPLGALISYDYDTVNNLVQKVDRNDRITAFVYDDVDRPIGETWTNADESVANTIGYAYDKASNLLSVVDDFSALAWTYDARDRAITESNVGTPNAPEVQLTYTYDAVGNVLSVTDTIDGTAGAVTTYLYDALNRMERVSQSANGGLSVADKRVDIAYNAIGQYSSITRYSDLTGTQLVVDSSYQYDSLNRIERLAHDNSTATVTFYDYVYDGDSRISSITDIDGVTNYTHDNRDQLTSADHADANNPDETYTYDANGNRISSHLHAGGYVTGPGNRLLSDGTFNYGYDGEGNRVLQTDIATGDYREFEYDHRNRLAAVIDFSTADVQQQRVEFIYDSLGRRISKNVESVVTHFVYDGNDVLLDFHDPDGVGGNAPVFSQRYMHGPMVDQVLAQESSSGDTSWLLTDHLGTTRDLVDSMGQLANHITYDSYGNLISESNPGNTTRYQFTGRESDQGIDLQYYRTRFYDSTAGRFISEDALRFADGTNPSRYVLNSPIASTDPFGEIPFNTPMALPANSPLTAVRATVEILDRLTEPPMGRLIDIDGDDDGCIIERDGQRYKAKVGDFIRFGDKIVLNDNTAATVEFGVGGRAHLRPGRSFTPRGPAVLRGIDRTIPQAVSDFIDFDPHRLHKQEFQIQTAGGTGPEG